MTARHAPERADLRPLTQGSRVLPFPAPRRPRPDDLAGLRVALFTDTWAPQLNGVTRTLARLTDVLAARGAAVCVAAAGAGEDDADAHAHPSVPVVRWGGRAFPRYPELRVAPARLRRAAALLHDFRPSLVHAATPFGVGLAGRWAARRAGVPLVTSYHTHLSAYAAFYGLGALAAPGWAYLRWFHNGARRTYAPTHAVARELAVRGFRGVGVWGRGVDTERFSPAHRDPALRAAWGARPHDVVALYVGRLAREKGVALALAAARAAATHLAGAALSTPPHGSLRQLPEGRPDPVPHALRDAARPDAADAPRLVLVIVGDGPDEGECRAAAPPGTVFTGRLTGAPLAAAYASADVFLFPSQTDTFGNVLLEAMASGLAVLAADAPPTRELLGTEPGATDGGWRGVVAPAHAEVFGTSLAALAADAAARRALGGRGRAFAVAQSWDAVFDALFADYRAVAAGWDGAGPAVALRATPPAQSAPPADTPRAHGPAPGASSARAAH